MCSVRNAVFACKRGTDYTHLQHFSTSITIVDDDDVNDDNDDVWISIRLRDLRQHMYLARDYYLYGNTFTNTCILCIHTYICT